LDIIVKSKNFEVTNRLKEETIEKIQHASRFFDRLSSVEVVLREESNPRIAESAVVEVTARAMGRSARSHHIRAEGSAENHREAVDMAVTRFARQLSRYKARMVDRRRKAGPGLAQPASHTLLDQGDADPGTDGWPESSIVRTKRFELQPMLPDDAALQLELLGHDFYVFTNVATGNCNVVYRRKDGDLGLIEAVT
jgi:putative sigma-54 modulation protein